MIGHKINCNILKSMRVNYTGIEQKKLTKARNYYGEKI